jgi:hypothetical protein
MDFQRRDFGDTLVTATKVHRLSQKANEYKLIPSEEPLA